MNSLEWQNKLEFMATYKTLAASVIIEIIKRWIHWTHPVYCWPCALIIKEFTSWFFWARMNCRTCVSIFAANKQFLVLSNHHRAESFHARLHPDFNYWNENLSIHDRKLSCWSQCTHNYNKLASNELCVGVRNILCDRNGIFSKHKIVTF